MSKSIALSHGVPIGVRSLVEVLHERFHSCDVVSDDEISEEVSVDCSQNLFSTVDQIFDWVSWSWSRSSLGWLLSWGRVSLGESGQVVE